MSHNEAWQSGRLGRYLERADQTSRVLDVKYFILLPSVADVGSPYVIIGESGYGKPLLDRVLRYQTPLETALKVGYLAFDATRTSATDVDFPLDIVLYRTGSFVMAEQRYTAEELMPTSDWWQENMQKIVAEAPAEWMKKAIDRLVESSAGSGIITTR